MLIPLCIKEYEWLSVSVGAALNHMSAQCFECDTISKLVSSSEIGPHQTAMEINMKWKEKKYIYQHNTSSYLVAESTIKKYFVFRRRDFKILLF